MIKQDPRPLSCRVPHSMYHCSLNARCCPLEIKHFKLFALAWTWHNNMTSLERPSSLLLEQFPIFHQHTHTFLHSPDVRKLISKVNHTIFENLISKRLCSDPANFFLTVPACCQSKLCPQGQRDPEVTSNTSLVERPFKYLKPFVDFLCI